MINLVYSYFNNGEMLDIHIKEWEKYKNKKFWKAIIVDDCSEDDPAKNHIKDVGFPIELYRINTDITWNTTGARNLGMTHADNTWCLLTDIDHLLTAENAELLLKIEKNSGYFYRLARQKIRKNGKLLSYKSHLNSYFLEKKTYWRAGGYDERYLGCYGTDFSFRNPLEKMFKSEYIKIPLLLHGLTMVRDASTTKYDKRDPKFHFRNYCVPKEKIGPLSFEWVKIF
jgi:glycosyltransferase involved in cell wall biosynthesis